MAVCEEESLYTESPRAPRVGEARYCETWIKGHPALTLLPILSCAHLANPVCIITHVALVQFFVPVTDEPRDVFQTLIHAYDNLYSQKSLLKHSSPIILKN